MRLHSLCGAALVAAPVIALAALPGSATAAPDDPYTVEFDSPSTVAVEGRGGDAVVTYTNQSGHNLICYGTVGDPEVTAALYADAVDRGTDLDRGKSSELVEATLTAGQAGRLGLVMELVPDGSATVLSSRSDEDNYPGAHLDDGSFTPHVYTECWDNADRYVEIEIFAPAALPSEPAPPTGSVEWLAVPDGMLGSLG